MPEIIVAPSLLSSDFARIADEIQAVEEAGADWLHIDVMDGHYVPNITIGPPVVSAIKKVASKPLDVHLMISDPDKFIPRFIDAGADYLTVHHEACIHLHRTLSHIIEKGAEPGVSLNPSTPSELILPVLNQVSLVLFMSVNPGFGGQKFIPEVMDKVDIVREEAGKLNRDILLSVDGGIDSKTCKIVKDKGIRVLVAGSYIFRSQNYKKAIQSLR
ncbi:MAG: ribulose-phosphate 3-epimerase [candidate division Zixibacteria bacterium]|nr:ribulose-phosphate 3-epimerase [candidate division Zixibacteria bacterium]